MFRRSFEEGREVVLLQKNSSLNTCLCQRCSSDLPAILGILESAVSPRRFHLPEDIRKSRSRGLHDDMADLGKEVHLLCSTNTSSGIEVDGVLVQLDTASRLPQL